MRRVKRFMETNKMAHEKLNVWLEENPQALLVSVKPIDGCASALTANTDRTCASSVA